jgi:hypothetical protein
MLRVNTTMKFEIWADKANVSDEDVFVGVYNARRDYMRQTEHDLLLAICQAYAAVRDTPGKVQFIIHVGPRRYVCDSLFQQSWNADEIRCWFGRAE